MQFFENVPNIFQYGSSSLKRENGTPFTPFRTPLGTYHPNLRVGPLYKNFWFIFFVTTSEIDFKFKTPSPNSIAYKSDFLKGEGVMVPDERGVSRFWFLFYA